MGSQELGRINVDAFDAPLPAVVRWLLIALLAVAALVVVGNQYQ